MSLSRVPGRIGAATCACVVVGLLLLMASGTAVARESVKGVTGATGATGPTGPAGATGPAGTFPKVAFKNEEMKGTWSASFNVAAGGLQQQVDAPITFQIPLNEELNAEHIVYLNEKQSIELAGAPHCVGNSNQPEAEPGYLCIFTGANNQGGCIESESTNFAFHGIEDPQGNLVATIRKVSFGVFVVFRTNEFSETPKTKIAKEANLCTGGAWAVTEAK